MKNSNRTWYLFSSLVAVVMLVAGCNQGVEEKTATVSAETNAATNAATTGDCCGKCQGNDVVAGDSEGCCGKCGEEAATVEKTDGGCANDCNACEEGDCENCKCGDQSSSTVTDDDSTVATKVNSHPQDRDIFHFLLQNHEKITRKVTELENGVKTVTESTDPAIVSKLQDHVSSMYRRVEEGRPLRMWDDLYREIFKHADKIEMTLENTENGISVVETSEDEYVVKLIQAHAKVVSGFAERGFAEARENHEPPKK